MTWTLTPNGSWATAVTDNPATELAAVLALPQSHPWYPYSNTVLVRNDQWLHVNLLTANQTSFESGTTAGWAVNSNCTIASSTAQALAGARSLALTSVAAGDMAAQTPAGLSGIPVLFGQTYKATCSFRAATAARNVFTAVVWFDAGGASLGPVFSGGGADSTTGWTSQTVTAPVPTTGRFVAVLPYVQTVPAAGEVHYIDQVSLYAP